MKRQILLLFFLITGGLVSLQAQDPVWLFQGVIPQMYQRLDPVPAELFTDAGHELTRDEIFASLEIRPGDPVVLIRDGAIAAVKGLGGFHLACRANSDEVVRTLRQRKARACSPSRTIPG